MKTLSDEATFKWAIIGPGSIAHKFVDALKVDGCGQLHGVLASGEEKGNDFLKLNNAPDSAHNYSNIDQLLSDREVNAVYIATPHSSHYEFAKQCLEAGIPVLCEKPLTVNALQAQSLVNSARENHTFLMEAMWSKMLPVWQRVRELLSQGSLGKLDQMSADMGYLFQFHPEHRLFNPRLAGGILLDMGIYTTALGIWLMQEQPKRLQSMAHLGQTGVDEKTLVNMQFSEGVVAQFSHTCRAIPENAFWIYGERGYLRVDSMFWQAEAITYEIDGKSTIESFPFQCNGFEYQIRNAIESINSGQLECPHAPHRETLEVMVLLDRIREQIGLTYEEHDYQHAYV